MAVMCFRGGKKNVSHMPVYYSYVKILYLEKLCSLIFPETDSNFRIFFRDFQLNNILVLNTRRSHLAFTWQEGRKLRRQTINMSKRRPPSRSKMNIKLHSEEILVMAVMAS